MKRTGLLFLFGCVWATSTALFGAGLTVALTPSLSDPQPVGTSIEWTAGASSQSPGPFWYRFTISEGGGHDAVVKDFSPEASFTWTPSQREGSYTVGVSVRDTSTNEVAQARVPYTVTSRVLNGVPSAISANHPLVALYSAPPCPTGSFFRARFRPESAATYTATPLFACTGSTSMNVHIAGLYPTTTYTIVSDVVTGGSMETSAPVQFTTGAIDLPLPAVTVTDPLPRIQSSEQNVVLYAALTVPAFATDLSGNVIWYLYPAVTYIMRPTFGGTIMASYLGDTPPESRLFEFDLAGNPIRQTNAARISEELAALGVNATVNGFHHDAMKLPDGNYLVLAATERIVTDVQGPGPVDILGDLILVLDSDFQVRWVWNSFDHLDLSRPAVLGETCVGVASGCPPIFKAGLANDWLHGNSISLARDGNIIYSARHQDFVYKIAYENGAGDGHVIWKLGKGGDFTALSSDPYPWQSHQHDVEFVPGTNLLTLYDNGNTRNAETGGNSRGQVIEVDEEKRTVTYRVNQDLGAYSFALGSAQALLNGNYHFESGAAAPSFAIEVSPVGSRRSRPGMMYKAETPGYVYRSFRMRSMYEIR